MKKTYLLLIISFISYVISIAIVKFDTNFTYRWFAFYLHVFSLLLITILWIFSLVPYRKVLKSVSFYGFLLILFLATASRLFLLTNYPFVSVGDELRDGGLNGLEIATGQLKNIFDYGRYGAHGLIIPTITSFFYKMFYGSVLVYRLPAAVISILDIILLYILLSVITKNRLASFLGAMTLVSLPLHLFYSRTQIVVILSSFFATVIITSLFIYLRRKCLETIDYIFLATLVGFSLNFHASLKVLAILVFLLIIIINFYIFLCKKGTIYKFILRSVIILIFLFVGFGPRLLYINANVFFHTLRVPLVNEVTLNHTNISHIFKDVSKKYIKSLLVWITQPTNAWYPDHKPILNPILFGFMILGIITGAARKNLYLITVVFIAFVLHLTNSALTDILNGDHRLSPLFPIGSLFVGIGLAFLLDKIKVKSLKYIFAIALFIFMSYQTVLFFTQQPANKNKDVGDYLSMHAIYFLKSNNEFNKTNNIIFFVSPFNYQKLNYLHYKEQYTFFFPKISIEVEERKTIEDNEIYIKNKEYDFLGKNIIINCKKINYYCPINYKNNIVIHY